jgi:hypothetical protein
MPHMHNLARSPSDGSRDSLCMLGAASPASPGSAASAASAAYDFTALRKLVDVGGGRGMLLRLHHGVGLLRGPRCHRRLERRLALWVPVEVGEE